MSGTPPAAGADPSMDDILASIRKILNEDDPPAAATAPRPVAAEPIQLTPEMMIAPPESLAGPVAVPVAEPLAKRVPTIVTQPLVVPPTPQLMEQPRPEPPATPSETPDMASLLDPMAAAAAIASLGKLSRVVAQERSAHVTRSGPSIEDVVREELRPLLKEWLDAHLPGTVERLVRAEIERVMARQG